MQKESNQSAISIDDLKKYFEGFDTTDLVFKSIEKWGSDIPGSKYLLMDSLKDFVTFKFSKSHCENLGGYFAVNPKTTTGVGLDIEEPNRITYSVVRRIYPKVTEDNFKETWVALEAAFKGLRGFKQPQTLSQLTLEGFEKINSQIETFCLKDSQNYGVKNTRGLVFKTDSHFFAFFMCTP